MPRDANGNYTLPAGNPVVTGTVITSTWANPTMSDIGQEITNSLSRDGQGGMLVPLEFADGTVNDPSVAFTLESGLGFYRKASGQFSIAGQGKDIGVFDAATGTLSLESGDTPTLSLAPDAGGGFPNIIFKDDGGFVRGQLFLTTNNGAITLRRFASDGIAVDTSLDLQDSGNVSLTGGANVPTQAANLTRKDYVDANFGKFLAGYLSGGTHAEYTDDLNDIAVNSTYKFAADSVTNEPSGLTGASLNFITTFIADANASVQVIYARASGNDWQQYQRQESGGVWSEWKLIVDGGAFTSRLAGYEDNLRHALYEGDFDAIVINSFYNFVPGNVTNEPADFVGSVGFIETDLRSVGETSYIQRCYGINTDGEYIEWRRGFGTSWSDWKRIIDGGAFTLRLDGYADTGLHTLYTGNLNDIVVNSMHNFAGGDVTNLPPDFNVAAVGFVETDFRSQGISFGNQWVYGINSDMKYMTWERHVDNNVWDEWKLVVDNGAFTLRLAGYLDNGVADQYQSDLDLLTTNSAYNFRGDRVTNEPADFGASLWGTIVTYPYVDAGVGRYSQVIYGMNAGNAYKIWMRFAESGGVWEEWILVADGQSLSFDAGGNATFSAGVRCSAALFDLLNSFTGGAANIDMDFSESVNNVSIRYMRDTNTPGARRSFWHAGNGSGDTSMELNHGTGRLTVAEQVRADATTPLVDNDLTRKDYVDARLPTGGIVIWPASSAPVGYFICDGQAISRTTYADLFAVISSAYGDGDGSTTFNLPDYRGQFLRGKDSGAGVDPDASSRTDRGDGTTGDNTGTKQADLFEAHDHGIQRFGSGAAAGTYAQTDNDDSLDLEVLDLPTTMTGGNETRPVNIYVNYIIKT